MKKLLTALFFAFATIAITSCSDDEENCPAPTVITDTVFVNSGTKQVVTVDQNITVNTTWTADKEYLLKGNIYVESGATLTISECTVIKGDKATKGGLIISRGAKIDAKGTASCPIVFTSNQPKGQRDRGDWAGVVILGKANANNLDASNSATIEGISAPIGDNGLYGGTNNADNSGTMQYVRIEFAGIALNPDNELNSLTMGAVGSATTIDHIQVSYAGDDAFEWFGGTVSHEYMVALRTLDDDFDTDKGYTGKLQYGLVMRDPQAADVSGSRAMEASSSSTAGDAPVSHPIFANFTLLGPKMFTTGAIDGNFKHGVRADKDSDIEVHNSIVAGFPTALEKNGSDANPTYVNNILINNDNNFVNYTNVSNITSATTTDLYAQSQFNLVNASAPVLKSGSTYLTGAPALGVTGLNNEPYYGAFGTSSNAGWSFNAGWLEFDPQNITY